MKGSRILVVITLVNLTAAAASVLSTRLAAQADVAPIVRTRALQIVDGQGRVRASLEVLPASTSGNAPRSEETVLLRLITERGRPSVKIGASEDSAGLSLAGPTGTSDTYVILQAKGKASSLKLRNEDGREQVIKP
jgi:hypothetical protein